MESEIDQNDPIVYNEAMGLELQKPFNGQPPESEQKPQTVSKDFFYSSELHRYVSYEPLKVSDRLVKAASEINIPLSWDDEGRINNISYIHARKLMGALGASLLSPAEYWRVHAEALRSGDQQRIAALESDTGTEWLDAVFRKDDSGTVSMIEHPEIEEHADQYTFAGESQVIRQPEGRPGWFHPSSNIDQTTGMPYAVETSREKGSESWSKATWKYWSTFKVNEPVVGIRGYVTSSDTPSLDLDIPPHAAQGVLFLRETREMLEDPALDQELLKAAKGVIELYGTTTALTPGEQNQPEHDAFYDRREEIIDFIKQYGQEIVSNKQKEAYQIQEQMIDMLGIMHLESIRRGDLTTSQEVSELSNRLFPLATEAGTITDLTEYMRETRNNLAKALEEKKKITFVMGHKNPDTDTAISALMEAYRNAHTDTDTVYIPVIQAGTIPDEIAYLLGEELSRSYMLTDEELYQQAKASGQARWILVDHNSDEQQKFSTSIIDHHKLSTIAQRQQVSKTWEMVGSCSAQVAQKMFGIGMIPDTEVSRIIHGATLMDTENRGPKKMTYRDTLIMDTMQELSGIQDENALYQELMSHLLNTEDTARLFERDYKEDWGIWGFAVAKVKNVFDENGVVLKPAMLSGLVDEANKNNQEKNFAMTMIKVVDYLEDNETVNREKLYMLFNETALPEFKEAMFTVMQAIIRHEFEGRASMSVSHDAIEFWGVGDQLSRKVTAPKIEELVGAFNEHFYSPEIGRYVQRDFLKGSDAVRAAAEKRGITISEDNEGRITNITYHEAKILLAELGMEMLSLPEYWKVYNDAERMHDEQMASHLISPGFVEFLDTILIDGVTQIDHPTVTSADDEFRYSGDTREVHIPKAVPSLMYPDEVDALTGLPRVVHDEPEKYDDPKTWRVWSPDTSIVNPTRGHIFLLKKPALDMKIHPDDALRNMGIRPTVSEVKTPSVLIDEGQDLHITMTR